MHMVDGFNPVDIPISSSYARLKFKQGSAEAIISTRARIMKSANEDAVKERRREGGGGKGTGGRRRG